MTASRLEEKGSLKATRIAMRMAMLKPLRAMMQATNNGDERRLFLTPKGQMQ
jgi:hypothetical protein